MEKRINPSFSQRELAQEVALKFNQHGFQFYLVGGAVRSLMLGKDPHDLDFTTDAHPEQVRRLFKNTIPTGIDHGTVTVLWKGEALEVTTFRHEGSYKDHRHPDSVKYIHSLKEDLARRDFTINALAFDPLSSLLFDYFEGQTDLKKKIIRAIGIPHQRFQEDALRILRGCRLAAELGFQIEPATLSAMAELSLNLKTLSAERIYKEFRRTLISPYPLEGLNLLKEIEFFSLFLEQEPSFLETWERLNHLPEGEAGFLARLILFFLPFSLGAVSLFLGKLKFPNYPKKNSLFILNFLSRNSLKELSSDQEARRFLYHLGRDRLPLLLEIEKERMSPETFKMCEALLRRNENFPLSLGELDLKGDDLLQEGYQGETIGKLLKEALNLVLKEPAKNRREELVSFLRENYPKRSQSE
jgi:tRNA nucleotidyltransferase (CCA-adding enzyme)